MAQLSHIEFAMKIVDEIHGYIALGNNAETTKAFLERKLRAPSFPMERAINRYIINGEK
jgi:hypothetical protein